MWCCQIKGMLGLTTKNRNERGKVKLHREGDLTTEFSGLQFQRRREPEVFPYLQPFSWGILQHMLMYFLSMPKPEENLPYLPFPVVSDSVRSSNMTNRHQDNENIIRCCISSIMLFPKRSTIKNCSPIFLFTPNRLSFYKLQPKELRLIF